MKQPNIAMASSQQGAVLVVGLIILLLASLVAIGTMNNSHLQERMAANSQNVNRTLQTAESAIDDRIAAYGNGDFAQLTEALAQANVATPVWPTSTFSLTESSVTTSLEIRKIADALAQGASLDADESNRTMIGSSIFQVQAISEMTSTKAKSTVIQGFQQN